MREETGVRMAAKFMVLLNQIKEKSENQNEGAEEKKVEEEKISNTGNKDLPFEQSKKKLKNY